MNSHLGFYSSLPLSPLCRFPHHGTCVTTLLSTEVAPNHIQPLSMAPTTYKIKTNSTDGHSLARHGVQVDTQTCFAVCFCLTYTNSICVWQTSTQASRSSLAIIYCMDICHSRLCPANLTLVFMYTHTLCHLPHLLCFPFTTWFCFPFVIEKIALFLCNPPSPSTLIIWTLPCLSLSPTQGCGHNKWSVNIYWIYYQHPKKYKLMNKNLETVSNSLSQQFPELHNISNIIKGSKCNSNGIKFPGCVLSIAWLLPVW
jgi:hypothetical protein